MTEKKPLPPPGAPPPPTAPASPPSPPGGPRRGPPPSEILVLGRVQALNLADRVGSDAVQKMMEEAAAELAERLRSGITTGAATPTSIAQMQATLGQVQDVVKTLARKLGRTTVDVASDAADASATSMFDYLQGASSEFSPGLALPIREASMFSRAVSGAQSSVLRRLATTEQDQARLDIDPDTEDMIPDQPMRRGGVLSRYSMATIGEFEAVLQRGMLTGKPWGDVRDELTSKSPFLEGAPKSWAERIVRTECLLGETVVSGAMVRAVFRRRYEGPVAEVITEGGRKFTVTPNHPMLTRRAWVHAGELRSADHLICYRGQQNAGAARNEHVHDGPATLREIFDATAAVGVSERRRTTEPDFHGDGRDGEVDVLRPRGMLRVGHFAPVYEPLAERILSPSGSRRARFCGACRRLLSIQEQPCGCRSAAFDARIFQAARDGASACTEFVRERLRAFALLVASNDLFDRQCAFAGMSERRKAILCGITSGASQRQFAERVLREIGTDTRRAGSALGARPGDVEFDRVREVRVLEFSGHVFNLETSDGYFAINGAYTGNTMGAYNRAGWETIRAADDELGDMCKILSAVFDDRTGWDSYQAHGQIRLPDEAFAWAGGLYQAPPNRPNDREVVVPHRISWPIPDDLAWRGDGEVAAAWKRDRRKGSPPGRPLMTTIPLARFGKTGKKGVVDTSGAPQTAQGDV